MTEHDSCRWVDGAKAGLVLGALTGGIGAAAFLLIWVAAGERLAG